MYENYNKDLRVRGGEGFSSAMFRFTAHPRKYCSSLGYSRLKKLGLNEVFKIFCTESFFIIAKEGKPMIIKDYYFVESKRQEGVYAFEDWLETEANSMNNVV